MARRTRSPLYEPKHHIPLLAFTLAATPLFAARLIQFNNSFATFLAALTVLAAMTALTTAIFAHWQHTI